MESYKEVREGHQDWNRTNFGNGGQIRQWKRREIKKSVWAEDEHERFVMALKRYGRDWKAIESSVGTRTAVQIRSHAQKYFIKLKRHNSSEFEALPPPRKKRNRDKDAGLEYSDGTTQPTLSSPSYSPVSPHSTESTEHQEESEMRLTARDYACVDALSLLVCAADRMEGSRISC